MDIKSYLEQHKEAAALVGDLEGQLSNAADNAEVIRGILVTLIGKLKFHVGMEDKFIYPKAIESNNDNLKSVATKMQQEMGQIGEVLDKYAMSWNSVDKIKSNPDVFVTETKEIIAALKSRIGAEEKDFYPLVTEHL